MQCQKRGNAQPPTTVSLNEEVFATAARIGIEVPARALGNLSEVTVAWVTVRNLKMPDAGLRINLPTTS